MSEYNIDDTAILQGIEAVWNQGQTEYIKKNFPSEYTEEHLETYMNAAIQIFEIPFINALFHSVVGIIGHRMRETDNTEVYFPVLEEDIKFGEEFIRQLNSKEIAKIQLIHGAPLVFKTLCMYRPLWLWLEEYGKQYDPPLSSKNHIFHNVLYKAMVFSLEKCYQETLVQATEDYGISNIPIYNFDNKGGRSETNE